MAHIVPAKGTDTEASDYCKKDGSFWELGECKQMGRRGARNDLESVPGTVSIVLLVLYQCRRRRISM
jgi:hypothetical protein